MLRIELKSSMARLRYFLLVSMFCCNIEEIFGHCVLDATRADLLNRAQNCVKTLLPTKNSHITSKATLFSASEDVTTEGDVEVHISFEIMWANSLNPVKVEFDQNLQDLVFSITPRYSDVKFEITDRQNHIVKTKYSIATYKLLVLKMDNLYYYSKTGNNNALSLFYTIRLEKNNRKVRAVRKISVNDFLGDKFPENLLNCINDVSAQKLYKVHACIDRSFPSEDSVLTLKRFYVNMDDSNMIVGDLDIPMKWEVNPYKVKITPKNSALHINVQFDKQNALITVDGGKVMEGVDVKNVKGELTFTIELNGDITNTVSDMPKDLTMLVMKLFNIISNIIMDFESMNLVLKRKPTKRSTELEVNKKYPLLKMMVLDTKYGPNIKIATPEFFCFTPNRYYQYLKEPGVKTIQDMLNQGRSMGAVSKTLNTVPTMAHNGIRMIDTDDELDEKMRKFHTFGNTFCKIGEDNICMQICYQNWAEKLNKFEVRNDDIWVMGFPRSGTTWVQEMVWLIVNNLDYEGAKEDQSKRVPYFEMEAVFDLTVPNEQYNTSEALLPAATKLEYINKLKSPRMIKSHLHWSLLPEDITMGYKHPKIIYVLRNAKDVAISYYYLGMLTGIFTGSFEDFYELFLGDRIHYAPFWKVALSYWQHRHRPNFLFVRYKDMIDDLRSVIKQVAAFQGKELNDEQIEQLAEHLSFANMKNNRSVNPVDSVGQIPIVPSLDKREKYDFIRKGEQNGYIKEMSPEMIRKFDEWTKRQLEGTELVVD